MYAVQDCHTKSRMTCLQADIKLHVKIVQPTGTLGLEVLRICCM